ncbi:hypothetical protein [Kitasatospora setae]|uniref:hypothetical protein n=1 Tax=Kitasatospora setae TaxID=2066 RepID=UPI000526E147|nr:hypothetical protein [Kitasatospora setae]
MAKTSVVSLVIESIRTCLPVSFARWSAERIALVCSLSACGCAPSALAVDAGAGVGSAAQAAGEESEMPDIAPNIRQ